MEPFFLLFNTLNFLCKKFITIKAFIALFFLFKALLAFKTIDLKFYYLIARFFLNKYFQIFCFAIRFFLDICF